jgi:predicted glutamine amidotransferase
MCGLVGMAGDTSGFRKDVFPILLIVDTLRGMHSTGAAAVHRVNNKTAMAKQPGGATNLLVTNEYKDMMNQPVKCLIGHNRYATVGAHTIENAHPFNFDTLVGAHNGTLDPSDRRKMLDYEKYGTDSEALYATMDTQGPEATILQLTDRDSAYALTWYDKTDNTINFLRNGKRPLFYGYSEDRCTLFWASELRFLEFAAAQARVKLATEFFSPEPDTMHSWVIPKNINDKFTAPIKKIIKPELKTYSYHTGGGGYYMNGVWQPWHKEVETKGGSNIVPYKPTDKSGDDMYVFGKHKPVTNTKKWKPPYRNNKGVVINKVEFEKLVKGGCSFCTQSHQKWGEFIQPFNCGTSHDDYLCEECYNDDETFSLIKQLL